MQRKQEMMTIVAQKQLAPRIYQLDLQGELVKEMTRPGQFVHIKVPRADLLLRRPISINQIDHSNETCRLIYRVEGAGTEVFATMKAGEQLDILGPLGNGFDITTVAAGQTAFIVGGGIGIPHCMNYQNNSMKRRESDSFSWLCIKRGCLLPTRIYGIRRNTFCHR